jgi:hypothetical protein
MGQNYSYYMLVHRSSKYKAHRFVSFDDCGSIMAREDEIIVCKCLLKRSKLDGYVYSENISNIRNLLSIILFIEFRRY